MLVPYIYTIRDMGNMKRKVAKVPYEGYTLPKSSEKGVNFIDFNEPYKSKDPVMRIVKKRRKDE